MSGRAIRACDGCRVRKVRCNGVQPCSQCAHLGLACRYPPPAAKRKPGVRGRLVAQLRNSQAQNTTSSFGRHDNRTFSSSTTASITTSPPASAESVTSPPPPVTSIAGIVNSDSHHYVGGGGGAPEMTTTLPWSLPSSPASGGAFTANACSHHTVDYFLSYLALYEEQIYPVNPVLTCDEMRRAVENMGADLQDRALVYAFAAVTISLTRTIFTDATDVLTEVATLMNFSIQVHRQAETLNDNSTAWTGPDTTPAAASVKFGELPVSFKRIMTCIFLEICMMGFKRWDRSLMLLREAITMIQVLNVHQYDDVSFDGLASDKTGGGKDGTNGTKETTTTTITINNTLTDRSGGGGGEESTRLSSRDIARLRRVYWEVYIHERFLSTVTGFPCIQPALASVPINDASIPAHVDLGFNRLVHLFRVLDGPFLAHWTAHKDPTLPVPAMTAQWIESKQSELDRDEEGTAAAERSLCARRGDGGGGLIEVQHVDLFVTRVWLRTLVWQFALHHGLLRSAPPRDSHEGLSLHFPARRLSAQLRRLVARLQSVSSVVTHGSGILHKLFEITSTVADVLALPSHRRRRGDDCDLNHHHHHHHHYRKQKEEKDDDKDDDDDDEEEEEEEEEDAEDDEDDEEKGEKEIKQDEIRARLQDFALLVRFLFSLQRIDKSQRDYLCEKLVLLGRQYSSTAATATVDFAALAATATAATGNDDNRVLN